MISIQLVPHSSLLADGDGMAYFLYVSHFNALYYFINILNILRSLNVMVHSIVCLFFWQGLIRQLVLLPGSDATSRICPSSVPRLSALSVPQALLHLPIKPSSTDLPLHPYGETAKNINTTIIGCMSICILITKSIYFAGDGKWHILSIQNHISSSLCSVAWRWLTTKCKLILKRCR